MTVKVITDEIIADLFADGRLALAEFGLRWIEFRYNGRCYLTEYSDPCDHDGDVCTDVKDIFYADGTSRLGVMCGMSCANLDDDRASLDGIAGEYATGGTFSYLTDDRDLCARVYARAAEVVG